MLRGLGEGHERQLLAERLHLQESTLRGHVKSILQKLQVHSQLQAVLVGMRGGRHPHVDSGVHPIAADRARWWVSRASLTGMRQG